MSTSLEERVQQLERQFADLRVKFDQAVRRSRPLPQANAPKVGESYWKARAECLAKVKVLQPIDSTQAVSEDRDRG